MRANKIVFYFFSSSGDRMLKKLVFLILLSLFSFLNLNADELRFSAFVGSTPSINSKTFIDKYPDFYTRTINFDYGLGVDYRISEDFSMGLNFSMLNLGFDINNGLNKKGNETHMTDATLRHGVITLLPKFDFYDLNKQIKVYGGLGLQMYFLGGNRTQYSKTIHEEYNSPIEEVIEFSGIDLDFNYYGCGKQIFGIMPLLGIEYQLSKVSVISAEFSLRMTTSVDLETKMEWIDTRAYGGTYSVTNQGEYSLFLFGMRVQYSYMIDL
jgi:hypothetical protein